MTKRLVEIDDELLARARELSDAETIKGTVEEALTRLVRIETTKRHIRRSSALSVGGLEGVDGFCTPSAPRFRAV